MTDSPAGKSTMSTSPTPSFVESVDGEMKCGAEPQQVDSYPDRQASWVTSEVLGGAGTRELDANETPVVAKTNGEEVPETLLLESETNGEEAAATPVVAAETPSVETANEALVAAVRDIAVCPSSQKSHGEKATGASKAAKNSEATGAWSLGCSEADSEDGKSTTASMLEGFLSSALSSPRSSLSSADQSEWGGVTVSVVPTKASGGAGAQSDTPLCTKCGWPTEPLMAIMKTKATANAHAKYCCRPCNAVCTMLTRHVRLEGPLKIGSWPQSQVEDFFRRAQEDGKDGDKLQWKLVRGVLKKNLMKRVIESTEKLVNATFKPLDVWHREGYDVHMITAYNRTEWNPACGMTYAVPIKSISWSKKEEEIEEHIVAAEKSLKDNKGGKRGRGDDDDDDDDDEEEDVSPKKAKLLKLKANAAKEQERAAKKEDAAIKQHNSKMQILASKTMSTLSAVVDVLKSVVTKNKNFRSAPVFMVDKINHDFEKAAAFLKESEDIIKMTKKCAKDGTRLPSLTFDAADLGMVSRAVKKDISDFEAFEKLCR